MLKVDLHTHSTDSPDGGISAQQYKQILKAGLLDYIAITDHNRTELAQQINTALGDRIIVGEEIMTTDGEIIGLFLHTTIPSGLSPQQTAQAIKEQGGLVYVPHPFETIRHGITEEGLAAIAEFVDIIEICNGRAVFQDKGSQAIAWAMSHNIAMAASSDAHGKAGLGRTYVELEQAPTAHNLTALLQNARLHTKKARLISLLYPRYHRLRRKLKGSNHA